MSKNYIVFYITSLVSAIYMTKIDAVVIYN